MVLKYLIIAGLLVMVLLPVNYSQAYQDSKPYQLEGTGVRAGNLRIHPSVELESAFTDNLYRSYRDSVCDTYSAGDPRLSQHPCSSVKAAGVFRLLPGVMIRNAHPGSRYDMQLKLNLDARQYVVSDVPVKEASNLGGSVDGRLHMGQGRNFAVSLGERFTRVLAPGSDPGLPYHNNSILNITSVDASIKPGGGNLELSPRYELQYRNYEEIWGDTELSNTLGMQARLKFLPKTAVEMDTSFGYSTMLEKNTPTPPSMPLTIWGGLNGLITPKISLVLKGGYANSFHDSGSSFSNWIALGNINYQIATQAMINLSYSRGFETSIIANYYTWNRGNISLDMQFSPKLSMAISAIYEHRDFADTYPASAFGDDVDHAVNPLITGQREDQLFQSELRFNWYPREWMRVVFGYKLHYLDSNAVASILSPVKDDATGDIVAWSEREKETGYLQNYPYISIGMEY